MSKKPWFVKGGRLGFKLGDMLIDPKIGEPLSTELASELDRHCSDNWNRWKPIETAPNDGRLVLISIWLDGTGFLHTSFARKAPYGEEYITEGEGYGRKSIVSTATHWCEVPEDPDVGPNGKPPLDS